MQGQIAKGNNTSKLYYFATNGKQFQNISDILETPYKDACKKIF